MTTAKSRAILARMTTWDAIVVGSGAGGGVVAARLSEDPARRVLLLEAGPDFPDEATLQPGFYAGGNTLGGWFAGIGAPIPQLDWGHVSEPLANGRRVNLFRGRLMGGSTMINANIWVRGRKADFDDWVAHGATSWSWEQVLPWYERVERELPPRIYPRERWQPISHAFEEAYLEIGYRPVENLNDEDAWDGVVGPWPNNRRNEVRLGTLPTYIRAARQRPNCTVRGDALVDRVLLEGDRAVGVVLAGGEELRAPLVVVAGGVYGSPAVLLRSGIGPADELKAVGIDPRVELPVGRGLRDHPQSLFVLDAPRAESQVGGTAFTVAARGDGFWSFPVPIDEEEGIVSIALGLNRQSPDGTVRLASADPTVPVVLDHRFQEVIERGDFEHAHAVFLQLAETDAFKRRGIGGGDVGRPLREILLERMGVGYHPASSCAIGSVVDERLRVYGVEGLLVADASVFPENIANNLNMTCYMVGERAAAFIDGRE